MVGSPRLSNEFSLCVFVDVENIVATTITLDNPSEDRTCHNFNSAMFEVLILKKLTCMILNCVLENCTRLNWT